MAAAQRQIRDGGILHATTAPTARPQVAVAAATAAPIESPARVLQERLHRQAQAEFRLPRHRRSNRSDLPTFILGALALWGASLGGIGALIVKAAM